MYCLFLSIRLGIVSWRHSEPKLCPAPFRYQMADRIRIQRNNFVSAVKCNDSLTVLEVLAALGTGFDCASKTEINKVLSLGIEPERIIFANPAKPASHIRHAFATGVDLMTFDNEVELHKVKEIFPEARLDKKSHLKNRILLK